MAMLHYDWKKQPVLIHLSWVGRKCLVARIQHKRKDCSWPDVKINQQAKGRKLVIIQQASFSSLKSPFHCNLNPTANCSQSAPQTGQSVSSIVHLSGADLFVEAGVCVYQWRQPFCRKSESRETINMMLQPTAAARPWFSPIPSSFPSKPELQFFRAWNWGLMWTDTKRSLWRAFQPCCCCCWNISNWTTSTRWVLSNAKCMTNRDSFWLVSLEKPPLGTILLRAAAGWFLTEMSFSPRV